MNTRAVLTCLRNQWQDYIERHGHSVERPSDPRILQSCSVKGQHHRWLLLVSTATERQLDRSERSFIRAHIRRASKGERVYLVVGFPNEPGQIVALPARTAVRDGCIFSNKAGITWDS